jgi:spermidine/putrescine transport system ATP-binding protein
LIDQIDYGLTCFGISKSFDNFQALDNVSLTVEKGEILAILGPSGCGKTTLMRIIAGLELPDNGQIVLSGKDITNLPASKRNTNMVFQSYALFPHLNVFSNIAFGLKARKFPKNLISTKVADMLELLQMEGLEKRFPHQLSGGQKQRVALARALVNEPEILLLDEPMSALDAYMRAQVQEELKSLQKTLGTTFILVTHDHNEAKRLSDHMAVMKDGKILQHGNTASVFSKPETEFVAEFLGATNFIPADRHKDNVFNTPFGQMMVDDNPDWDKGKMLIWPDRIEIDQPENMIPGVPNWCLARVEERFFNGDDLDVLLVNSGTVNHSFHDGPIKVMAKAPLNTQNGQELAVKFPKEALLSLDKKSAAIIH